jgi:hypothetical protein
MYGDVCDSKHKFVAIKEEKPTKLKPEQKGFREYLFCISCEEKLSVWENNTIKDLRDISSSKSNFLKFTIKGKSTVTVSNIKHNSFKKCVLSILFRLSITSFTPFKKYQLGPHQEIISKILDKNSVHNTFDYPVRIKKVTEDVKHENGVLFGADRGRFDNHIMQSFVAFGFFLMFWFLNIL